MFTQTLQALKVGGKYPADMKMTKMASMEAIDDSEIQKTISHLEVEFEKFEKLVQSLVNVEVNSDSYRKAQVNINSESNNLRALSNELVQNFKNNVYLSNQAKLNWAKYRLWHPCIDHSDRNCAVPDESGHSSYPAHLLGITCYGPG